MFPEKDKETLCISLGSPRAKVIPPENLLSTITMPQTYAIIVVTAAEKFHAKFHYASRYNLFCTHVICPRKTFEKAYLLRLL